MSSVQLLDKTRKIGKLLHNNNSSKVVFNDICNVLKEILQSNVLVISKKGKILGVGRIDGIETLDELFESKVGVFVDSLLNERFLSVLSTKENVNLETLGYEGEKAHQYKALLSPIDIAGERLGTLFIYKKQQEYEIDDIILCEYGTTVVGLEMLRSVNEESAEDVQHDSDTSVLLVLQTELKEKNDQIANLQELLKNQQILTLDLSRENKEKTLLLEHKKWWQFWK